MPTTIPLRLSETRSDDGLVSFCLALLAFYVVLALVLLLITGATGPIRRPRANLGALRRLLS
jgi:hypothetical protein